MNREGALNSFTERNAPYREGLLDTPALSRNHDAREYLDPLLIPLANPI